jgi:polyisoprenoid-binding protein YceI
MISLRRELLARLHRYLIFLALTCAALRAPACAQDSILEFDSAQTAVKFTLDAALHSVHGDFRLKKGVVQLSATTGKLSGEVVVDAKSGATGNGMRDRKMHKDILESETYSEISFRPDRVEGVVATQGKSSVKVHGIFAIHGVEREITVPAEVEMGSDRWSATLHFTIPYAKWGMKNPSTLFLRVSDTVEIEISAAGNVSQGGNNSTQ